MINKNKALQDWAQTNPFLSDYLTFDFLKENQGSCTIIPVQGENIIYDFFDSNLKEYRFALSVMFAYSENSDATNTDNMFMLETWQNWIDEQEKAKNYPDFGEKCSDYKLYNLNNMPRNNKFENGLAQYIFEAKLEYLEEV